MRFSATILAIAGLAVAQRPTNTSICDYYTTALLKTNNATNQETLLTLLVNTAVIGNYTQPNVGIAVPGILAKGTYNGTAVNLLPYFNGALKSTNRGNSSGVAVNFLDGGGAAPLMMNKPANGTTSAQYALLTHLYEYFGDLLGCSMVGKPGFPSYAGVSSQYNVHKYMALNNAQVGYFITQVGLSAASFGVATADVTAVGTSLSKAFGMRCSPPAILIPNTTAELHAICITSDCPIAANSTCASYAAVVQPASVNGTTNATSTSGSTTATASKAAAAIVERAFSGPVAAVMAGAAAFAFAL